MIRMDTDTERIVAVLHDVIEDSSFSLEELSNEGYPPEIIDALDNLTRGKMSLTTRSSHG